MITGRSPLECRLYIELHPCDCGGSVADITDRVVMHDDTLCARYSGHCSACGQSREYLFALDPEIAAPDAFGGRALSTIIDAGQYLAASERAAKKVQLDGPPEDRAAARYMLTRAIACLDEVMKDPGRRRSGADVRVLHERRPTHSSRRAGPVPSSAVAGGSCDVSRDAASDGLNARRARCRARRSFGPPSPHRISRTNPAGRAILAGSAMLAWTLSSPAGPGRRPRAAPAARVGVGRLRPAPAAARLPRCERSLLTSSGGLGVGRHRPSSRGPGGAPHARRAQDLQPRMPRLSPPRSGAGPLVTTHLVPRLQIRLRHVTRTCRTAQRRR